MLVVVPDLRNQHAPDILRPRVDIDTLVRIKEFLQAHSGMQISVTVKNPYYQPVQLSFTVCMHPGNSFNHYANELQQALRRTLTPWAFEDGRQVDFGGHIYRSVLLDYVEELDYVDFVSDFQMRTELSPGNWSSDMAEVAAATPDSILVSAASHVISEANKG